MNAPTRRALTGAQMTTILAAVQAVDDPAALLATVLGHVYDALLQQDGRRLADLRGSRISPQDWQIPVTQWDAIAEAASAQAERWGTGPQLRADLLDRMPGVFDDPDTHRLPAPPPGRPGRGLRLLCVSLRGDRYLVGHSTAHPVDTVPAGVGTRFASLDGVHRYVRGELRGVDSIWHVRVIDERGAAVMYGFRAGPGGTGETWIWRRPALTSSRPHDTSRCCHLQRRPGTP